MIELYRFIKQQYEPHLFFRVAGWVILFAMLGSLMNFVYSGLTASNGLTPVQDWGFVESVACIAAVIVWVLAALLLKVCFTYIDLLPLLVFGWISTITAEEYAKTADQAIGELEDAGRGKRKARPAF